MNQLKSRIIECMKKWRTITFDDLEMEIPELKDDGKNNTVHFLSYEEPYDLVFIWAMSKEGRDAINDLIREKSIELVPFNPPMIGFMEYASGRTSLEPNEAQLYPILENKKDIKTPHWCPAYIKINNNKRG